MTSQKHVSFKTRILKKIFFGVLVLVLIGASGVFLSPWVEKQLKTLENLETSIQKKVNQISFALDQNARLKLENAKLRQRLQAFQMSCQAMSFKKKTHAFSFRLKSEAGSPLARVFASITYRPPEGLSFKHLFTLGVSYFLAKEYEKSGVIFSYILENARKNPYQSPRGYLLGGMAWYQLDHFKLGIRFFKKVLAFKENEKTLKYQAKARLWLALSYQKIGNKKEAQSWLLTLVDHHPYSQESFWINREKPAFRKISQVKEKHHLQRRAPQGEIHEHP